ncbi:MAG: DUF1573 domain-containing protein [Cytophagaceae bacterium]|nr:DUF1573 domain-containing protein [Cytophagaceae bacterium]
MKLLTFVFLLLGGALMAQTAADSADLEFKKPMQDFGDLYQQDSVRLEYVFANTGKAGLILSGVYSTCGCTIPSWPKDTILPGQEASIWVTFRSEEKIGRQNKAITIYSNAKGKARRILLTGNVLPGKKK